MSRESFRLEKRDASCYWGAGSRLFKMLVLIWLFRVPSQFVLFIVVMGRPFLSLEMENTSTIMPLARPSSIDLESVTICAHARLLLVLQDSEESFLLQKVNVWFHFLKKRCNT